MISVRGCSIQRGAAASATADDAMIVDDAHSKGKGKGIIARSSLGAPS